MSGGKRQNEPIGETKLKLQQVLFLVCCPTATPHGDFPSLTRAEAFTVLSSRWHTHSRTPRSQVAPCWPAVVLFSGHITLMCLRCFLSAGFLAAFPALQTEFIKSFLISWTLDPTSCLWCQPPCEFPHTMADCLRHILQHHTRGRIKHSFV